MKIAHIADLHCSREHAEEALTSLRFLAEHIKKSPVDLIAIAGDTWDASMLNTEASGFNRFVEAIRDIADLAPVAMIYGTPSHDTDGSLEIFQKITCEHGITILEPGQAYFMVNGSLFAEDEANQHFNKEKRDALIFGIPEPRKKYLLANASAGKEETEETIREAMHKVCFLLGAKRKEYLNIPCVLLYHGDIAGSVLQNDQSIERGTGISITVDELNDTGADYFALGHIHKPQQVGKLPAYYAGSIYPKNFGETHKAGFNVVDFEYGNPYGFPVNVERVDFPHLQNMKIEIGGDKLRDQYFLPKDLKGYKVWLEITCTKEMKALVNTEKQLQHLISNGAASGSRVTVSEIALETIRAAEITEVNTPEKKFEVWAENSSVSYSEGLLKKVKTLEPNIMLGAARAAGEWELVSVKLRGAIGIKKGIHKDEIALDFDDYSNGLIALTGANGRGKTSLIENCHPYPQLLTRGGKLQDHFFLRDSYREVIYRNRAFNEYGSFVKFLIQIDGQNKSGSCKYFIFDAKGFTNLESVNEWIPRPSVDGNLKPYEEELTGIFGPMELYLRTAFITQKATKKLPDITDATAGEKKTLFVELAGIDYLQRFSEAANEKAKLEDAKKHDAEIKMQVLSETVSKKEQEEALLHDAEASLQVAQNELEDTIVKGKAVKTEMEKKQEEWNAEQIRQQKENEVRRSVDQIQSEIKTIEQDIVQYQSATANIATYTQDLEKYGTLQKTVEAENQKKQKHLETNMAKQQAYMKEKTVYNEKVKKLEVERDNLCDHRNSIERLFLDAEHNIKLYARDAADIKEDCPTCGQRLPADKLIELKTKRDQFAAKISKEKEDVKKHSTLINEIEIKVDALTEEIADISLEEPAQIALVSFDDTVLRKTQEQMNQIDIAHLRASLDIAREATVRIEGLKNQIADKKKLLDERCSEVRRLLNSVADGYSLRLNEELKTAVSLHNELTERYTTCKAEIARTEATIEAAKKILEEITEKEAEYSSLKRDYQKAITEGIEWDLISKAFGRDGIQALELDALAPGISDTANRILSSAYGDRFKIAIETTRLGGAGKKTKQIEDFIIKVIDSEDGEAVNLDDKSGGEAVWIKRAIYDAFAVIRKRNTNFAFLTCFQDETDGALDSAAKTAYCRMLEAAHAESKLRHTFIITHSNEVKAMIEQKIDMEELATAG